MNIFRFALASFLWFCLGLGAYAQAEPEIRDPLDTAKIIVEFGKILGPDSGSLLYQDSMVLTIAGVQPLWLVQSESLEETDELADQLKAFGDKHSLDIRLEYQSLRIVNKQRLQSYTSASTLPWMIPYSPGDEFDNWAERLDESAGTVTLGAGKALFSAAPDFVVATARASQNSLFTSDRAVKVELPLKKRLLSEKFELKVLPEDVTRPELQSWLSRREQYLDRFFALDNVQKLIRSKAFHEARKRAGKEEPDITFLESWWSKEGLERFEMAAYVDDNTKYYEEQILQENFEKLSMMVRSGEGPRMWARFLNRKCYEAGYPPTIQGNQLANWIWYGAYKKNQARAALYESVKETQPACIQALVEDKLSHWRDYYSGGPGFVSSNMTERLFRHPECRRYFAALPPEKKDELRTTLRPFLEAEGCRAVLIQSPYKLEEQAGEK